MEISVNWLWLKRLYHYKTTYDLYIYIIYEFVYRKGLKTYRLRRFSCQQTRRFLPDFWKALSLDLSLSRPQGVSGSREESLNMSRALMTALIGIESKNSQNSR